jgi:hypothetical protein
MSTFNFSLSLPSRWFTEFFANLYCKSGSFENWPKKHWEFEITQTSPADLFELEIDLDVKGRDHAGPSITMVLLGFSFAARIYDERHWHHEENRWLAPGEDPWDDEDEDQAPTLTEEDFQRAQPATEVLSSEAIQDFKSKSDK